MNIDFITEHLIDESNMSYLCRSNNSFADVEQLSIDPHIITKLKKANLFSLKKILNFSLPELQRVAKVSANEANLIYQAVSLSELKSSVSNVYTMFTNSEAYRELMIVDFFKASKNFDGLHTGTVTEICGESGSGKTQMCLLLAICALMPKCLGGLATKVIYIHSEGEFPIQRFVELSNSFQVKNHICKDKHFTDNLILKKVFYLKEFMHILQNAIPELLQKELHPKVLIVDSVAALLRSEFDSFSQRNQMIKLLATELWKLANIYKIVVICVNQVSGSTRKQDRTTTLSTDIPSLGLLWGHILTTRLQLSRKQPEESVKRQMEVVYSSYHPHICIDFIITGEGIEMLNENLLN